MTKGQMERFVRVWQARLGLERWDVRIDWSKPCSDENVAEAERSQFYDSATIRLEPGWAKWKAEYAEQAMVHELLHLCHRVTTSRGSCSGTRGSWRSGGYRQAMEGFIDRMASRLVELAA